MRKTKNTRQGKVRPGFVIADQDIMKDHFMHSKVAVWDSLNR